MSDVKRYTMDENSLIGGMDMLEDDDGDYVLHSDYSALLARHNALVEAARPVVKWWEGLKRNAKWNGEKVTPEMVAMSSYWEGQPVALVEQLDALVGEEGE